jgi:hypothetical protein
MRPLTKTLQAQPRPTGDAPGVCLATVKSTSSDSNQCEIEVAGDIHPALLATHVPGVVSGQQVAAVDGGQAGWLITAAWPLPGQADKPFDFDPATGTLRIHAARLNLAAVASIELQCGEARIRLSVDGKAQIEGKEILSAAIGSNRIEGASIDLN